MFKYFLICVLLSLLSSVSLASEFCEHGKVPLGKILLSASEKHGYNFEPRLLSSKACFVLDGNDVDELDRSKFFQSLYEFKKLVKANDISKEKALEEMAHRYPLTISFEIYNVDNIEGFKPLIVGFSYLKKSDNTGKVEKVMEYIDLTQVGIDF